MEAKAYIYLILFNGSPVYVGRTKDFNVRKTQHLRTLKNGDHHNSRLQAKYNEIDPTVEFRLLETCLIDESHEKELWWYVEYADLGCEILSVNPKFSHGTLEHSEEIKRRIRETKLKKTRDAGRSSYLDILAYLDENPLRCYLGLEAISKDNKPCSHGTIGIALSLACKKHKIIRPTTPRDWDQLRPHSS